MQLLEKKRMLARTASALGRCPVSDNSFYLTPTPTPSPLPTETFTPYVPLTATPTPVDFVGNADSLSPYHETLSRREVKYFLDKVAFGGNASLENIGSTQGLSALVNYLMDTPLDSGVYNNALFWAQRKLAVASDGTTTRWVTLPTQTLALYESIFTNNPFPLRLAINFWHPHFSTNIDSGGFSNALDQTQVYLEHWKVLRDNAVGNFIAFNNAMMTDTAMARWLNLENNTKTSPNQNFPREFMELFVLGAVDPLTKIPNYGEDSVAASTAFFSGFKPITDGNGLRRISYVPTLHDNSVKTVFAGIPGATFTGNLTPTAFIDYVLNHHPGASRYIGEKLFAQLVHPDTNENIVNELAGDLLRNHYDLKPILRKLLSSEAMFSQQARNVCVSSPIDVAIRIARKIFPNKFDQVTNPGGVDSFFSSLTDATRSAGQSLFQPQSVFGWKDACGLNRGGEKHYGEGYISEQNLLGRMKIETVVLNSSQTLQATVGEIPLPSFLLTPDELIEYFSNEYFNFVPNIEQKAALRYFLLHSVNAQGVQSVTTYNLSDKNYRAKKIRTLVGMIFDLVTTQMR